MEYLFYGFLIHALGGVTINRVNIGPLISVGAYYLIYQGILKVDRDNLFFNKIINFLFALMIMSGLSFLLGIANRNGLDGILGIAIFVLDIIVFLNLIKGIATYSDKLNDPKQTIKLFKRWRMRYILIGVIMVISIVAVIVSIASVPWSSMIDFFNALRTNPTNVQGVLDMYLDVLQPVLITFFVWLISVIALATAVLIFEILQLVAMYKISQDYARYLAVAALQQPASSNPSNLE